MSADQIQIVAGVIYNKARNKVLLAKRQERTYQGEMWEFPGGKIHTGERTQDALKRELLEELDIVIDSSQPLIHFDYDYPDKLVSLNVFEIVTWEGNPKGKEGQKIEWVLINNLSKKKLLKANKLIVTAINLPSVYWITPDLDEYGTNFLAKVESYLTAGLKLIQFRNKRQMEANIKESLEKLLTACNKFSCRVLLNDTPEKVIATGAHGIHLPSKKLMLLKERPLGSDYLIAASCHNEKELDYACEMDIDFVVLPSVNKTSSHPLTQPLGWKNFKKMTSGANIPVYALGGMNVADIKCAKNCGGQGVAMISGLWDKANAVSLLQSSLNEEPI